MLLLVKNVRLLQSDVPCMSALQSGQTNAGGRSRQRQPPSAPERFFARRQPPVDQMRQLRHVGAREPRRRARRNPPALLFARLLRRKLCE